LIFPDSVNFSAHHRSNKSDLGTIWCQSSLNILSRVIVTIDRVLFGNWIYWSLTVCKYK
jgi:hypothetical protein